MNLKEKLQNSIYIKIGKDLNESKDQDIFIL